MPNNYLIIGDDEYFRGRELSRLRDKYLSEGEIELNYSVYGPGEMDGVMDSLGTMPFLAENRVVLVKDAEDLSEDGAKTLISYLKNPMETSVLLISAGASMSREKFYRELSGGLEVVRVDKPKPYELKKRVSAFFRNEKVDIAPRAVDLLIELKDDDTTGLKEELEKLAAFSEGARIEPDDVRRLVGRSARETVFTLVDAINARDAGKAFRTLEELYEQKKRPEDIVGYIGWYLRGMQKVVLLKGRGSGEAAITAETGMKPWQVRKFIDQSRKYTPEKIDNWVRVLYETDRSIKTGRKKPALAIEMLLSWYLKK